VEGVGKEKKILGVSNEQVDLNLAVSK